MIRLLSLFSFAAAVLAGSAAVAGDLKGEYLETRTCDVYTGPCFANGQVGLTGKDAIMAWSIERGSHDGVSLAGLKVVVVTTASDTLGFGGTLIFNAENIRSVIIVDAEATRRQREALVEFATRHATHAGEIVKVISSPIDLTADHFTAEAKLSAGNYAEITTRKLGTGDCVCSNEKTFYPPLCDVRGAIPAYTVHGHYSGPGLGTHWSNTNTRSAFLASFSY